MKNFPYMGVGFVLTFVVLLVWGGLEYDHAAHVANPSLGCIHYGGETTYRTQGIDERYEIRYLMRSCLAYKGK